MQPIQTLSDRRFRREIGLAASIADLIEPALADLGFRLVRVHISGRVDQTLQIMAERPDGTMTIEDCERVSRHLSPLLDAHDPIAGAYRLEVSSPGIDRPLVRASDFSDWRGYEAKIELVEPREGRRRYKGRIEGLSEGEVAIEVEREAGVREVVHLPLNEIGDARLVLTDDLIREALRRAKKAVEGQAADGVEMDVDGLDGDGATDPVAVPAREARRGRPARTGARRDRRG